MMFGIENSAAASIVFVKFVTLYEKLTFIVKRTLHIIILYKMQSHGFDLMGKQMSPASISKSVIFKCNLAEADPHVI